MKDTSIRVLRETYLRLDSQRAERSKKSKTKITLKKHVDDLSKLSVSIISVKWNKNEK